MRPFSLPPFGKKKAQSDCKNPAVHSQINQPHPSMDMRFLRLILICRIFSLSPTKGTATNNTRASVSHARHGERERERARETKARKKS